MNTPLRAEHAEGCISIDRHSWHRAFAINEQWHVTLRSVMEPSQLLQDSLASLNDKNNNYERREQLVKQLEDCIVQLRDSEDELLLAASYLLNQDIGVLRFAKEFPGEVPARLGTETCSKGCMCYCTCSLA